MQKVINILVSIVFLISFIGININKHYSHGELYSTALFQEAESCCAAMEDCEMTNTVETSQHNHNQEGFSSCENKIEIFKISDVFVSEKFSFPHIKTIDLCFVSLFKITKTTTFFKNYNNTNSNSSPPLSETDAQSEFGVFLI